MVDVKKVACPSCGKQELSIDFENNTCLCSYCRYKSELDEYIGHKTGLMCRGSNNFFGLLGKESKAAYPYFLTDKSLGFLAMVITDLVEDIKVFELFRQEWPEMRLGIYPLYIPNTAVCPLCGESNFHFEEDKESQKMVAVCSCGKYRMVMVNYIFARILERIKKYTWEDFGGSQITILNNKKPLAKLHLRVTEDGDKGFEYTLAVENLSDGGDVFDLFLNWVGHDMEGTGIRVLQVNKVF